MPQCTPSTTIKKENHLDLELKLTSFLFLNVTYEMLYDSAIE
jgi:hypothetical protein